MAPHIRSHRAPCSCFPKNVSLQLSSEHSVGDVWIAQLDRKRVPQARSSGCKSCRHNYWVFVAPRKSERQLTAESAECCRTRGSNHLSGREAPARTATAGEPVVRKAESCNLTGDIKQHKTHTTVQNCHELYSVANNTVQRIRGITIHLPLTVYVKVNLLQA